MRKFFHSALFLTFAHAGRRRAILGSTIGVYFHGFSSDAGMTLAWAKRRHAGRLRLESDNYFHKFAVTAHPTPAPRPDLPSRAGDALKGP
jgi:hypothetical protein